MSKPCIICGEPTPSRNGRYCRKHREEADRKYLQAKRRKHGWTPDDGIGYAAMLTRYNEDDGKYCLDWSSRPVAGLSEATYNIRGGHKRGKSE